MQQHLYVIIHSGGHWYCSLFIVCQAIVLVMQLCFCLLFDFLWLSTLKALFDCSGFFFWPLHPLLPFATHFIFQNAFYCWILEFNFFLFVVHSCVIPSIFTYIFYLNSVWLWPFFFHSIWAIEHDANGYGVNCCPIPLKSTHCIVLFKLD